MEISGFQGAAERAADRSAQDGGGGRRPRPPYLGGGVPGPAGRLIRPLLVGSGTRSCGWQRTWEPPCRRRMWWTPGMTGSAPTDRWS